MEKENLDTFFLAKWLENDLDPQEKEHFEQSSDYPKYVKIIEGLDKLQAPAYDKKKAFDTITKEIYPTTTPVRTLQSYKWLMGVAASIMILVGLFLFSNQDQQLSTDYGEQAVVALPDGSEVTLNARSTITYNEKSWEKERLVTLDGEAFFKVQKGSTFTVVTKSGKVAVLGTQFTVNSEKNFFEVVCHEGKVRTTPLQQPATILTQGNAYRIHQGTVEKWNIATSAPSWITGESTFKNAPLLQVISAMQKQFNITIQNQHIDSDVRFTGSYSHEDLTLALKTIFIPMEISFTFKDENTIVLVKE